MKLGTENPKKVIIAVCLLAVAAIVLVRGILSFSSQAAPEANMPPAAGATGTTAPTALPARKGAPQIALQNNLDPRLRLDLLQSSESIHYEGNGRNIFRVGAEPVKAIPKPVQPPMQTVNLPPPPPQINLKFFGFASTQGTGSKVFLAQGDDVFVGGQGDIVDRRYKILRITPTSVEVEDVVSNIRQTIPLTQG